MDKRLKQCPDCSGDLKEISVLDWGGQHGRIKGFRFTLPGLKRKWFSSKFEKEGELETFSCTDCGRVFFYRKLSPSKESVDSNNNDN